MAHITLAPTLRPKWNCQHLSGSRDYREVNWIIVGGDFETSVRRACAARCRWHRGSRRLALSSCFWSWSRSPERARVGCGSRGAFDGVGIYGRPRAPGIPDSHKLALPAARKYRWGHRRWCLLKFIAAIWRAPRGYHGRLTALRPRPKGPISAARSRVAAGCSVRTGTTSARVQSRLGPVSEAEIHTPRAVTSGRRNQEGSLVRCVYHWKLAREISFWNRDL